MKNITGLLILVIVMASCQKEAINTQGKMIQIVGQNNADNSLKTTFINPSVNWNIGDHIGVFSDRAYVTVGNRATNVDYTANQNASTSTFSSTTPIYFDGTYNTHSFSAIYPRKAGATFPADAWTQVPISLPDVQTQDRANPTAHIGPLDAMIAKSEVLPTVTNPAPIVNFTFHHLFTIIKFNVSCATAHRLKEVKAVNSDLRIISVSDGNTINIGQDYPGDGKPYGLNNPSLGTNTVTLTTDMDITSTPAAAYMVIFPQNFTGFFTITFKNENNTVYTLTKTGITLDRGKVYDVAVAIPNGKVLATDNAWE